MICLDTHTLVWMALLPSKLSAKANRIIEDETEFLIADISLWEIAILHHKKRLIVPLPLVEFLDLLIGSRDFIVAPINPAIAEISTKLIMQKDPADRLICATALYHNLKLITKDKEIIRSGVVEAIW